MADHEHEHDHDHDHGHSHAGLDVQVERSDDGAAKISFTVSAEEFDRTVQMGLRNMAGRTRMKGFRPGKVPARLLEKQFGEQVRGEAVQHFLNHAYDRAVKEHDLRPAAHPRVDLAGVEVGPGEPFSHEFEVFLRPAVELGAYKGLEIESRSVEVTDDEVEAALADLRRQQSRAEPIGEEGLPADGMAVCKLVFRMEGRDEPLMERDGIRLSPKAAPTGVDAAAFEEALTGAKEKETVTVPITFPDEFPEEEARGKEGTCEVTIDQGFRIAPPEEEELYRMLEVEDAAGLEAKARERIGEAKEEQERNRIEGELLDQVIELHPMQLPEAYLRQQVDAKAAETRRNLVGQGMPEEEAEAEVEAEMDGFRTSTEKALRAVYLLEEIAKAEGIKVGEAEIGAELRSIARRNGVPVEEVGKYYQEQNLFSQLALELLERKVRSFLRESADIRLASS